MSATPSEYSPWPTVTPSPPPPRLLKRKRSYKPARIDHSASHPSSRQIVDPSGTAEAEQQCQQDSSNDVYSCFPTSSTIVPQDETITFVWNSRLPYWHYTNLVNVYLLAADTDQVLNTWNDVPNPSNQAGTVKFEVNDSWWPGSTGTEWNGSNISRPYYFVITANTASLDGNQIPQSTFTAVQTTYAASVASSLSSASAASASSASSASAASASAASASAASASSAAAASRSSGVNGSSQSASGTRSGGASGTSSAGSGNLAPGSGSSGFPHWAIAVIVVLGFLAIVALGILTFLIMRRMRRRNASANSMESSSPMMAGVRNEQSAQSPLLARGELSSPTAAAAATGAAAGAAAVGGAGALERSYSTNRGAGSVAHDGASTVSDSGPFSVADAAIMADAFRQALRNADFAGRPVEEGESPEQQQPTDKDSVGDLAMNRELADEGRDIRDVGSSRGVTVRTLSGHDDGGDTVTDHTHTS